MPNKNLNSYISLVRKQTGETRSVREFRPLRTRIITPDVEKRLAEYRALPSKNP